MNATAIYNYIPIFYLKYVDDVGDYNDTKETIRFVLDVWLWSYGLEGMQSLKHLRKFSLLGKILRIETLTGLERIALAQAVGIAASSLEILSSTASLL